MMKILALLAVFAAVSGTELFYENYCKKKVLKYDFAFFQSNSIVNG